MDRHQREAELHEILERQDGRVELLAVLKRHAGEVDQNLSGTPLVDAILGFEYLPGRAVEAGDQKFDDPPATEAPGGWRAGNRGDANSFASLRLRGRHVRRQGR